MEKSNGLPKDYISPSQLNMYLRCPAQYYFRYIRDIKLPPRAALTRGKAVHEGLEYNYSQKIESRADRKLSEVLEFTAERFDVLATETEWAAGEEPGKVKDETLGLTGVYQREISPTVQPILVEQEVKVEIPEHDLVLLGYIDLVDSDLIIRDTKTSARSPQASVIDKSLQLTAYAYAYQAYSGEMPSGVALDYAVSTKVPKCVTLRGTRTPEQIARWKATMARVAKAIRLGCFYPSEDNFLCSPERCGYWDLCHKEF